VDDADADPAVAAALFEKAAPHLDPPTAMVLEAGPPQTEVGWSPGLGWGPTGAGPSVRLWRVRTPKGAYRLKLADEPAARAALLRGARAARVLRSRGLPVPEVVAATPSLGRVDVTAVVEERLGTTDAASSWRALGPRGRAGVEQALGSVLRHLRALPPSELDREGVLPDVPRSDPMGAEAADALLDAAPARERLDEGLRATVRERLRAGLDVPVASRGPSLAHGALSPASVALDRRSFAGVLDLEGVRWGDPWDDVAAWASAAGGPFGVPSKDLLLGVLAGEPPTEGLGVRLDALVGLRRLRAVLDVPDEAPPSCREALVEALSWWAGASSPSAAPAGAPP
jgi:aminoglycoside phosphotransferase (APT) family kinase protein